MSITNIVTLNMLVFICSLCSDNQSISRVKIKQKEPFYTQCQQIYISTVLVALILLLEKTWYWIFGLTMSRPLITSVWSIALAECSLNLLIDGAFYELVANSLIYGEFRKHFWWGMEVFACRSSWVWPTICCLICKGCKQSLLLLSSH